MTRWMYWLEVDGDRTGLEVLVNSIPAERLLGTHGIRFPINEYLISGENTVEVRAWRWPSGAGDDEGGEIKISLRKLDVDGATVIGETRLLDETRSFTAEDRTAPVLAARFVHSGPGSIDPGRFTPLSPDQAGLFMAELERIAGLWRSGNGAAIAEWMNTYIADYVAAYPLETVAVMNRRIARMAEEFVRGSVLFDPAQVRLEPVAGGRLVDCTSPEGAAVRILLPSKRVYNMWAVMGVVNGRTALVR